LDCRQGIRRFARLGDGDNHIVGVNDRLAVTELAGVLHLDRHLRELLHSIHGYQARMPRGAAGGNDDTLGIEETLLVVDESREGDVVMLDIDPPAHRIGKRARLLKNLLDHKMRVTTLLQLGERKLQPFDFGCLADIADSGDVKFFATLKCNHLLIVDIDHLVGIFDNGGGIGSKEILVLTDTDHQRTALAGGNDDVGV